MENVIDERITRLFRRNRFDPRDIKYMTHTEQRTYLFLLDGRKITTTLPLKTIAAALPEKDFWSIQKGIVVSARQTASIDGQGVYTMVDGRQFQGRGRNPAEHKRRRCALEALKECMPQVENHPTLLDQCALLDEAPFAFCVIEMVFAEDGHSIDFVFRYCNKQMEVLDGMPNSQLIDRPFYEVFPNGDRKWVVPYADVALNGTKRTLREYSPEIGKNLFIQCYQPKQGYCACLLNPAD